MALSKVRVIGSTGSIGKHIVNASIKPGHKTFVLVRSTIPSDFAKAELLKSFQDAEVTLLVGDSDDHASLVAALRQVEVVIVNIGGGQILEQIKIIVAAKETGTIKRFIPSEYGLNFDRLDLDTAVTKAIFGPKLAVRRALEKAGIPYTFVAAYCFFSYFLNSLAQDNLSVWKAPPRDGKLIIFGDGNAKAVWNDEVDIAIFTVRSVDDPRAANKNRLIKGNVASLNEVIALCEKKIGHKFEKEFLNKESVLKSLAELPPPRNIHYGLNYCIFIKDDQSFELHPSADVEAIALYPDVTYNSIDGHLSSFV